MGPWSLGTKRKARAVVVVQPVLAVRTSRHVRRCYLAYKLLDVFLLSKEIRCPDTLRMTRGVVSASQ